MLTNGDDTQVQERLRLLREDLAIGGPFIDALEHEAKPFALAVDHPGYEFVAQHAVEGRPNRAVLKLFEIHDGPMEGLSAAFFFKRSQVPFSRDRFSYGVVVITPREHDEPEIDTWLEYASSGFDPALAPKGLRRAFTFTVPE